MWQPISSHPKDGSLFLGFDGQEIVLCWWDISLNRKSGGLTSATPLPYDFKTKPDEDWLPFPTHWHPLPDPPKQ